MPVELVIIAPYCFILIRTSVAGADLGENSVTL